jgi:low temperature requirement protein LtrA
MHVSDHKGLLRARDGGEQPVTPFELFFDLVYVFAVTQLSHRLLEELTVVSTLETLLLLLVVWSAWVTNWFDPNRLSVRLMLVTVMLASLFMSVAIPETFGERGLMFALA